jgi:four helix bundle protein
MSDFKQLKVWHRAHKLTLSVYALTRQFPKEELYGLTSQLRRAAASIGANIAEGCGRKSDGEMNRFLQIARGSAAELEYHLLLSRDLHIIDGEKFSELIDEADAVQRMLTSLMQRVKPVASTQQIHAKQGNSGAAVSA